MTDLQETLARFMPNARRDHLKQARAYVAPALKFANRNPILLISAGVIAVAGIVAFANRKKIAAKAGPVIEDAKTKGQAMLETASAKGQELMETASAKGQELMDEAKTRGEAVIEKVRGAKASPAPRLGPTDIH